jgi:hypothetical protein
VDDTLQFKAKFRHNVTCAMRNYQGGTDSEKLLKFVKRQAKLFKTTIIEIEKAGLYGPAFREFG